MRTSQRRLTAASLAGTCLAALGLLVAACGSSPGTPAAARTVTVTPAPATKTVTISPAPSGPGPCLTSNLRLTVGASNGAAGTIYYPLDLTSAGTSACTLYGYPGVAFVTSPGGSSIGAPAGRRPIAGISPALITLQPGASAHAILAVSYVLVGTQSHSHQVPVITVQVYPPDEYTALFAPIKVTGCADRSLVVMWVSPVTSGS